MYARNSSPPDEVVNVTPPVPLAVSTVPFDAAPEFIAEVLTAPAEIAAEPTDPEISWLDPTEVALRWVELMLPATMETVEVPDAVDTEAGEVPITALT